MASQTLRHRTPANSAHESRALSRGAVGDFVDARSKEGRFLKQAETELLAQFGDNPTFVSRALVRQAVRLMLASQKLDGRLAGGEDFTSTDAMSLGGLSGALLDILRELRLPQTPPFDLKSE